jgi:hypothetical protein
MRFPHDNLPAHEVMVFADELDLHLRPKDGAAWRPQGTQEEIMTPGTNEQPSLAGALQLAIGTVLYCLGPHTNNELFRALWTLPDATYPARQGTRISVVVDNDCMHKATAVEPWLARHPRFEVL